MRNDHAILSTPAMALAMLGFFGIVSAQTPFAAKAAGSGETSESLPVLTHVEQIRHLSLAEAERHYPVKLHGVVLDYSSLPTLFIADDTGSIFVRLTASEILARGDVVEIEGTSDSGKFAPMVIPGKLRVVGKGELPPPRDVSFQRLSTGVEDSQWVRVSGIVRSTGQQILKGKLKYPALTLATEDGGRLRVLLGDYRGDPVETLVDAEVAVAGIAESIYNDKRQLMNVRLLTPGRPFITIRQPAPAGASATPLRFIETLRQFSFEKPSGHRIRVRGIVTFQQPGEGVFIRDETGSIRVETQQKASVSPGDRVEVLGFPNIYDYAPTLEDAAFQKIGTGAPPQPVSLSAKEVRSGYHYAELIRVDAQLVDQFRTPDQLLLDLQEGDTLFRAQLGQAEAASVNIRNGARLRLTGICLWRNMKNAGHPWPREFQMLVRAPSDLAVLRQPSWWTPQRMRWAICILTGILLGVGIWVWTLQRQLLIQTAAIREKIEREAILQERMRIAREFHDSLEQELAGVRMQLELTAAIVANSPQSAITSLQMARTMICHSQAEARRSVWELRSQVFENRMLPAALSAAAKSVENGLPIDVDISGEVQTLPMRVESNLLRIAQEAITNSIKHGRPRRISVRLSYEENGARLNITDDGCGFSVNDAPDGQQGHFGLLGMRERADKMSGMLQITSTPGKGTCVEIFVPVNQEASKEEVT